MSPCILSLKVIQVRSLLPVQRGPRQRRMEDPPTSGDRDLAWLCDSEFRSVGLQGVNLKDRHCSLSFS